MLIKEKELKKFFNLSYGEKAPSREEWESLYNKQVKFIDPTQERNGIDAYIKAQDGLIRRCDDIWIDKDGSMKRWGTMVCTIVGYFLF